MRVEGRLEGWVDQGRVYALVVEIELRTPRLVRVRVRVRVGVGFRLRLGLRVGLGLGLGSGLELRAACLPPFLRPVLRLVRVMVTVRVRVRGRGRGRGRVRVRGSSALCSALALRPQSTLKISTISSPTRAACLGVRGRVRGKARFRVRVRVRVSLLDDRLEEADGGRGEGHVEERKYHHVDAHLERKR